MDVEVVRAELADKEVLRQLLEFNAYEFARLSDDAVLNERGRFGYSWLDHYWTEPTRHPFLIRVRGQIGGIVLVTGTDPRSIAEFLVMPQYRRLGVGLAAARYVFELFGGAWSVHEVPGNEAAVAFWRRAIPVEFAETCDDDGTTQRFRMPT
ncbi:MAG TPA: GNAT family N-acetyltransferase [Mycobacteriales bacterium]